MREEMSSGGQPKRRNIVGDGNNGEYREAGLEEPNAGNVGPAVGTEMD